LTFSKQFQQTITTSKTFIPDEPDFSVTNPLKKNVFCNGVEIVCSPEFTRKGAVVIKVDGITQFDSRNSGGFQRIGKLPVTLNTPMKRDVIVDVFVFNEIDTNEISCTVTVYLSEESKNLDSSLQYISDDVVNSLVSEIEELFQFRVYNGEDLVKLIDMKGYKKLIIIFSSSTVAIIEIEDEPRTDRRDSVSGTYDFTQTFSNITLVITGDIVTKTDSYDIEQIWDFGETRDRSISATLDTQLSLQLGSVRYLLVGFNRTADGDDVSSTIFQTKELPTYDIDESDDSTFTTGVINIQTNEDWKGTYATTKRYFRIIEHVNVSFSTVDKILSSNNNIGQRQDDIPFDSSYPYTPTLFSNWTDSLSFGGSASVSFEVRNPFTDTWGQLISSSEFGTIGVGRTLITQIGDVTTTSVSGKTYALPSTQTDFRARLRVTNALETGVSIQKIS